MSKHTRFLCGPSDSDNGKTFEELNPAEQQAVRDDFPDKQWSNHRWAPNPCPPVSNHEINVIGACRTILDASGHLRDLIADGEDLATFTRAVANEIVRKIKRYQHSPAHYEDAAEALYVLQETIKAAYDLIACGDERPVVSGVSQDARLLAIATNRGIGEGDLDDAVFEAASEEEKRNNEHSEANASSLEAQVQFLIERLGFDKARDVIVKAK